MTRKQLAARVKIECEHKAMLDFIRDIATSDNSCTCHTESWRGHGHSPSCVQEAAGALYLSITNQTAAGDEVPHNCDVAGYIVEGLHAGDACEHCGHEV